MQDPTPLKQAGEDVRVVNLDTVALYEEVKKYIDLQVVTLDTMLRGDHMGSIECAEKSNAQLQKVAEIIGYDYMGKMQERIDAALGE